MTDDPAALRALLAALVEPEPWVWQTRNIMTMWCLWCEAQEPHHDPACPYVRARAVVAERGEEGT